MNHLAATLEEHLALASESALVAGVGEVDSSAQILFERIFHAELVGAASDTDLLEAMSIAAQLQRRLDGLLTELIGEADARSTNRPGAGGMAASAGCRNVNELVQSVTLASPQAVAVSLRVARKVRREVGWSSGEFLPPELPALRAALLDGAIGVDGVATMLGPLQDLHVAVGATVMRQAEGHLAAAARGGSELAPLGVRDLRSLAKILVFRLDPDGAEPREARALRKRGITFGVARDGLVPFSGHALVEVAAQFQRISDAMLNPRREGPRFRPAAPAASPDADGTDAAPDVDPTDLRTRAQKQHDVLATVLGIAARSGELPTIGGAAPTLVVAVREKDLRDGKGFATIDGLDAPVSIHVARHVGCESAIQRVGLKDGRIHSLGIIDRVFNHWQRKAIALRDGACVIPGCGASAAWCELHHVTEYAEGGPTHTDNGVLLCWWHHRTLGSRDGWEVRMRDGVPEVRPPSWHDASRSWRRASKSLLRPP